MSCKTCKHYSLYLMINSGVYSYAGSIPCLHCSDYEILQSQYEPAIQNNYEQVIDYKTDKKTP